MTFAEFERLPDEPGKWELLEGELIQMPPAKYMHMETVERLLFLLSRIVRRLRRHHPEISLGRVHVEMGYLMASDPNSWLQPDVSISHAGQTRNDYYHGAPLLAIEVASESQSAATLEAKAQTYLAHGSREVWLVYPKTRHLWICRAGASTIEREAIRSELLPGIEIRLDQIF
jgi:Uma2 family endonuclease